MEHIETSDRLLDLNEVRRLIPVSRTSMWKWRRQGLFPRPVQLPGSRVAWRASDIQKWITERPAQSADTAFGGKGAGI